MSEYIIDGALLTNIADAVRSVDGSTNTLTPEQMVTKLNTIKTSIDAALSAIEDKGVTVPDGSNSNNLAELIAQISSGGMKFTSGTYTPTTERNTATITHDLGRKPKIFIIYKKSNLYNSTTATLDSYVIIGDKEYASGRIKSSSSFGGWVGNVSSSSITSTSVSMTCRFQYSSTVYNAFFMAGQTFNWFAGVY